MRFSLAKEHLHYFQQHGFVEFEMLLKPEKLQQILHAIRKEKLESTEQHYQNHHDLWRHFPELKKNIFHRDFASIVADLSGMKPLRVGYDQLIPKGFNYKEPLTLREMSCIQGVVGGYLICLQDLPNGEVVQPETGEDEPKMMAPFSTQAGNMVFVNPDIAIDFTNMPCDHLLVCFVGQKAIYRHNDKDPHTHEFKKKGYGFGDKLPESELPTVLREFNL